MATASFQTPNLAQPDAGSMAIALSLDFTAATSISVDLTQDVEQGKLDFIQSIYVDNADNTTSLDLTFAGGPVPYRLRVQPFYQGWLPIAWPKGACRLVASSNAGIHIPVFFANFAMPYYTDGPTPGITVVPPLTNVALDIVALVAATPKQLVAGVALQTVKLYRGVFEVDGPCVLKFQDGAGGTSLFVVFLTVGGGVTFQVSNIPWFNTTAGNGLFVTASANCNLYGGFGHVQS